MKARCSIAVHLSRPTYLDCTMSSEFEHYQVFAEWCQSQIGFNMEHTTLDKDLLIRGNKMYGPEVCVFVPTELNVLLNKHKATRGKFPIGVHKNTQGYGFTAQCNVDGERVYLGVYKTPLEAFEVYKQFKQNLIKTKAKVFKERIDVRVFESLMNYEVKIDD